MQETEQVQVQSLGSEDPLEEGIATHPSILDGESHGQRKLEGYGPWGRKESDTTEHTQHSCVFTLKKKKMDWPQKERGKVFGGKEAACSQPREDNQACAAGAAGGKPAEEGACRALGQGHGDLVYRPRRGPSRRNQLPYHCTRCRQPLRNTTKCVFVRGGSNHPPNLGGFT